MKHATKSPRHMSHVVQCQCPRSGDRQISEGRGTYQEGQHIKVTWLRNRC